MNRVLTAKNYLLCSKSLQLFHTCPTSTLNAYAYLGPQVSPFACRRFPSRSHTPPHRGSAKYPQRIKSFTLCRLTLIKPLPDNNLTPWLGQATAQRTSSDCDTKPARRGRCVHITYTIDPRVPSPQRVGPHIYHRRPRPRVCVLTWA